MGSRPSLSSGLCLLLAAALAPLPGNADIGTVAAVNRDMDGTPPGGQRRALLLGNQVVAEELIQTSQIGSGQLMFVDQTTLTVSPNSSIVLDTYAYDADTQTGEIAISMARGAMRFIGGQVSKSSDARVTTPNATIGIRGGMVLIQVADDGTTRVIITAGEYVTITDSNGKRLVMSRPNAMAEISAAGVVTFLGLATVEDYADAYAAFEGAGNGGSEVGTDTARTEGGTTGVAQVNSGVDGGETNQPVSTSGEQPATQSQEDVTVGNLAQDPDDDVTAADVGVAPVVVNPTGAGGGVFLPVLGLQVFNNVVAGSRIGTTATGEVITIPVPETQNDFVTSFTNGTSPALFAVSVAPNGGLFEFGQTPGTEGDSTTVGALAGVGYSDIDEDFHVFQITDIAAGEDGIALFGTPTVGQLSVNPNDNGQNPATANTLTTLILEPSFDSATGPLNQTPILLIGNAGQARFPHPTNNLTSGGGQILMADAEIFGTGAAQESSFIVASPPLFQQGTGGLRFGGVILSTDNIPTLGLEIGEETFGTFEDANGNTVFGENRTYLTLSSLRRADAQGNTGGTQQFNLTDFGNRRLLGDAPTAADGFSALVTVNPSGNLIFTDPFPRALGPASITTAAINAGVALDPIMTGFAAGFAQCSTGNCGEFLIQGGPTGFIALRGDAAVSFLGGTNLPDENLAVAGLLLSSNNTSNILGATGNPPEWQFVGAPSVNERTVYLDDARFGGTSSATAQAAGVPVADARFGFASQPVAGDGGLGFPASTTTTSQFLTWGWWSAAYDVTEVGNIQREDAVHLGAFIVGAAPDPNLVPNTGVVSYGGFAVGTLATFTNNGQSEVVGGDFGLTYDFGTASGTISLDFPGITTVNASVGGNPAASHAYSGAQSSVAQNFLVSGSFFAGGTDPVAATAGQFLIERVQEERVLTGVYGGDALLPGTLP